MADEFQLPNVKDASGAFRVDRWVLDLLATTPDLKAIYAESFDEKGKAKLSADLIAQKITASDWYITNGPTVASNLAAKFKYGVNYYNEKIAGFKNTVSSIAASMGLDAKDPAISLYLSQLSETAFLHGWDQANIESNIAGNTAMVSKIKGGAYANAALEVSDYSNLYGMPLTDTQRKDYQGRLLGVVDKNGIRLRSSADDIKNEIRQKAANTYSVFKDQIMSGQSLWDITSAYRTKMADVLELDPESIKWDDPMWKDGKIFTSVDPKTGQMSQRPLYEVDKMLRQDNRWQYTKNANDTYAKYAHSILSKFGMVG